MKDHSPTQKKNQKRKNNLFDEKKREFFKKKRTYVTKMSLWDNNFKKWLSKVKLISRNFTKYSKIKIKAFNYAKKYNIDWRTKKIMSFINMS